ncbi:hypothetical protein BGZ60DRAFT_205808 [Tricladium varicosporioides]|nr:hypothetical protein BGZ60DRAFT_205808 [Hymenoscyphus varicosporioides]
MSCQFPANKTITATLQWWQVRDTLAQNQTCEPSSLRPNIGGALLPFIFVIIQIIVHLPVIIARVARWEDVQTLSIFLAIFNVAIVAQGYTSTNMAPEHVLVWSPMTLVIDAGAMLQLMVLVRAVHPNWLRELRGTFRHPQANPVELRPLVPGQDTDPNEYPNPPTHNSHPLFVAFVIITSSLLFLAIFALQVAGLVASFRNPPGPILASWCSAMFGHFGVAELDLNCNFHPVTRNVHNGIGCIDLPGARQHTWLIVTKITLILAICIEGVDALILSFVSLEHSWWIVQLRRPWFTMIFGLTMLVLILVVGTMDAYSLPPGISEKIWLIVDTGTEPFICMSRLSPAGLRGQLIGWLDGVLEGWNGIYNGSS